MFNTGRQSFRWMSVIVASALVAFMESGSLAGEPQEIVIVRRDPQQTIQILHLDGTTTKIAPTGQFLHKSPEGLKLVTVAEAKAEAAKENTKRSPSPTGEPQDGEKTGVNIYGDGRRETVKVGATRPSSTGKTHEIVVVRRLADQTIAVAQPDGTTTKIPPTPQFLVISPDRTKLVAATEVPVAEAVKEGAKRSPSVMGQPKAKVVVERFLPPGQIIQVLHTDGKTPLYVLNTSDVPKIYREVLVVGKEYGLTEAEKGSVEGTAAAGEPQKEEPKETITLRRNLDQTIEIVNADGTTTKIPPSSLPRIRSMPPASTNRASAAEVAAEAEKDNGKGTATPGRFQISPSGDSAILVDTATGKTWLLYYPDKKILSRLGDARGNSWKDMPCIWLPLHRPGSDAEIQQILARERSLRGASDKLRAEEQMKAEAEAKKRIEEFQKLMEERRKAGSGGTRRNADGTPHEPKPE